MKHWSWICYKRSHTHTHTIIAMRKNDVFMHAISSYCFERWVLSAETSTTISIWIAIPAPASTPIRAQIAQRRRRSMRPNSERAINFDRRYYPKCLTRHDRQLFVADPVCRDRRARSAKFWRSLGSTQGEKFSGRPMLRDFSRAYREHRFFRKIINLSLSKA